MNKLKMSLSCLLGLMASFALIASHQPENLEISITEKESILPPIKEWHGLSETLIQSSQNPWQTYAESSGLKDTPNYQETFKYIKKLAESDSRLNIVTIGRSPQGRDIWMLIVTSEGMTTASQIKQNNKPTLLLQAGIHSGEIDGKDAGLMLIRDILHGNKEQLIKDVNLLFVPILSVDAHERSSPLNRVNQRGPTEMGWRTNSQNLNLNRDYSKLDTVELVSMIKVINQWQPDLYFDVHVTDGEDYQYDLTYGFNLPHGDSSNIANWMSSIFKPSIDKKLASNGHLAGPLTFGVDSMDFTNGILGWTPTIRFSNGYGDVRHLPTVLVENHSLKPYKQRVLATYIFIEEAMKLLAIHGHRLIESVNKDNTKKIKELVLEWEVNKDNPKEMDFMGIDFSKKKDSLTGIDFIQWNGKPKIYKNLPIYIMNKAKRTVKMPKQIWIPSQYADVINRLQTHGIIMSQLDADQAIAATRFKAISHKLSAQSFEGRQMVSSEFELSEDNFQIPANSYRIDTAQPLGVLAVSLLDPRAPDSFFKWGFFNSIFQQTEYIESYAMIPLAHKLFAENPSLKLQFEAKKNTDSVFEKDQKAQMSWLYQQSGYSDEQYLIYPILMSY